jgi:hypothetical protein
MGLFSAAGLHPDAPDFGMDLFVTAFFLVLAMAGAALVRFAWPGAWGRALRLALDGLTNPSLLFNPVVHSLALGLLAVPLILLGGRAAVLIVLALLSVFVVASPALIALRPNWWLHAVGSAVVFVVFLGTLPTVGERLSGRRFGSDATVFLLPTMLFPVALALSGVVRWIRWRKEKSARSTMRSGGQ